MLSIVLDAFILKINMLKKMIKKAIYYLTLSANQNFDEAQNLLGNLHMKGEYVECNINKAIYYYHLSAEQNNLDSLFNMGTFYYFGKHIKRDIEKSLSLFKKLSNLNDPRAKNFLAIIYKNGEGVQKNIFMTIEFLNEGISHQTDVLSHYNLARIFYFGIDSVDIKVDKSIELLEEAFKRGLYAAGFFLFFIFSYGCPEVRDSSKADFYQDHLMIILLNGDFSVLSDDAFTFLKDFDLLLPERDHLLENFFFFHKNKYIRPIGKKKKISNSSTKYK